MRTPHDMKKILLKMARLPFLGDLTGWCIAHLAHVLPLKIVAEDERCIVFRHPSPSYDVHLLVMLQEPARDISCISAEQLSRVLSIAGAAVKKLRLTAPHIMLWTNDGRFQEVRQLHFHLFPSELDREADMREVRAFTICETIVRECIRGDGAAPNLLIVDCDAERFCAVLPLLINEYRLESRGYSVFWDISEQAKRQNRFYIRMG